MFETFRDKMSDGETQIALTMDIAYDIFLLYLFGNSIGFILFIAEITFKFVLINCNWEIKNLF